MRSTFFVLLLFFIPGSLFSQETEIETDTISLSKWKLKSMYVLNGTQSSFVNWSAGGRNNISALGQIEASATYLNSDFKWDTDLGLALGGLKFVGKGSDEALQKTDDKIDFATNFGVNMNSHWYAAFIAGFKTQFLDGFVYPNDTVRVSTFMAPGYVTLALGVDYSPNENFSIFLSPATLKLTFVQDEVLANAGAFGVEPAEYDSLGNVVVAGKMFRGEFGAYLKMKYERTLAKNIELKTKLELFSNYLDRPQNIDVAAEMIFNFKVNNWFSASLNWNLIYDHDIEIRDVDGGFGPRTQFKSVLGVGIAYTMKNFVEEE